MVGTSDEADFRTHSADGGEHAGGNARFRAADNELSSATDAARFAAFREELIRSGANGLPRLATRSAIMRMGKLGTRSEMVNARAVVLMRDNAALPAMAAGGIGS
jgi:hypothetical protein